MIDDVVLRVAMVSCVLLACYARACVVSCRVGLVVGYVSIFQFLFCFTVSLLSLSKSGEEDGGVMISIVYLSPSVLRGSTRLKDKGLKQVARERDEARGTSVALHTIAIAIS